MSGEKLYKKIFNSSLEESNIIIQKLDKENYLENIIMPKLEKNKKLKDDIEINKDIENDIYL